MGSHSFKMTLKDWLQIFIPVLATVLGLYFGPKLAVKRAIEQFRSTKWWDKQQEAYTLILEYLSTIRCDARIECAALDQDYTRERGPFLKEAVVKAYVELEKITMQGDYLISPDSAKALQEFLPTLEGSSIVQDPQLTKPIWRTRLNESTKCLSVLTKEARQHLEAKP